MERTLGIILLFFVSYHSAYCQEPIIEPAQPYINQEFKIKLPAARSRGLNWYLKEIRTQISPEGITIYEHIMPSSNLAWVIPYGSQNYETINGQDTAVLTFKATQPGTIILLFEQKHNYKNGKKVTTKKEVKVTVVQENIQKK
jgi:hypothetical protein